MDKQGQGALEYLLLIGGAVLVAVIVIVLLLSIADTGSISAAETAAGSVCTTTALASGDDVCANVTPVVVGQYTCTCAGTANNPNCTSTCVVTP